MDAKIYYLTESARGVIGKRELRQMINRRAYERKEIANTQITSTSPIPFGTFEDPYLFDVLGIKDEYLEADVEEAIIRELEKFILEFGTGFAFVARQKRMIIDGRDHWLDLLLYNRELKRLVAVELKYGRFEASHKGQLELDLFLNLQPQLKIMNPTNQRNPLMMFALLIAIATLKHSKPLDSAVYMFDEYAKP